MEMFTRCIILVVRFCMQAIAYYHKRPSPAEGDVRGMLLALQIFGRKQLQNAKKVSFGFGSFFFVK